MQTSSIVHNIIHSGFSNTVFKNQPINILSDKCLSIFDFYISNINNLLMLPISANNHDYSISYDVVLSNNPILFSSSMDVLIGLHLNSIIYFHNICPNNFKKEDKFLLKNAVNTSYKLFASEKIMDSWGYGKTDTNCMHLPYGLEQPDTNINKIRSVAVLNTNNNPSVEILYNHISSVFKDAILVKQTENLEDYKKAIRESVVCIEAESYYNIIYSIANGCQVLSTIDYIKENGLINLQSYNNILQDIHLVLESYDTNAAINNQNNILKKYSDITFKQSFINIITKTKTRPYIYAKTT